MSFYPAQPVQVVIPAEITPIRTKRLILRLAQKSDAPAIFEYRRRQEVANFL